MVYLTRLGGEMRPYNYSFMRLINCSERSFDVGDWVFLRLQPYKQMFLKQAKKDNKLSPKYYGLYKVLQNTGTMAYKLELPAASRVHPVFHVSCLKKFIGDNLPV